MDKKRDKKILLFLLSIIVCFFACGLFLYLGLRGYTSYNQTKSYASEIKRGTYSDKELVKELFVNNLKNTTASWGGRLKDYELTKIDILPKADNIKDSFPDAAENDIIAYIQYSIKPDFWSYDNWASTGNGTNKGAWIIDESNFLYIKEMDGKYSIHEQFTGW